MCKDQKRKLMRLPLYSKHFQTVKHTKDEVGGLRYRKMELIIYFLTIMLVSLKPLQHTTTIRHQLCCNNFDFKPY